MALVHMLNSCTEAIMRAPQFVTYVAVEKEMEHKVE